jgi:hypothetical protein
MLRAILNNCQARPVHTHLCEQLLEVATSLTLCEHLVGEGVLSFNNCTAYKVFIEKATQMVQGSVQMVGHHR